MPIAPPPVQAVVDPTLAAKVDALDDRMDTIEARAAAASGDADRAEGLLVAFAARRAIEAPALVVGHTRDPIHPAADAEMLADELVGARFVSARSILEWRLFPDRLDDLACAFVADCYSAREGSRRLGS